MGFGEIGTTYQYWCCGLVGYSVGILLLPTRDSHNSTDYELELCHLWWTCHYRAGVLVCVGTSVLQATGV